MKVIVSATVDVADVHDLCAKTVSMFTNAGLPPTRVGIRYSTGRRGGGHAGNAPVSWHTENWQAPLTGRQEV